MGWESKREGRRGETRVDGVQVQGQNKDVGEEGILSTVVGEGDQILNEWTALNLQKTRNNRQTQAWSKAETQKDGVGKDWVGPGAFTLSLSLSLSFFFCNRFQVAVQKASPSTSRNRVSQTDSLRPAASSTREVGFQLAPCSAAGRSLDGKGLEKGLDEGLGEGWVRVETHKCYGRYFCRVQRASPAPRLPNPNPQPANCPPPPPPRHHLDRVSLRVSRPQSAFSADATAWKCPDSAK